MTTMRRGAQTACGLAALALLMAAGLAATAWERLEDEGSEGR